MENVDPTPTREFRPELLSRRGELIAWGLTLVTAAAWLILYFTQTPIFIGLKVLVVLLGFSALAISLGNWMDRRTLLRIESAGVYFENGLRKARLHWEEIRQVEVIPSSWGNKVRVLGEQAHFDFRTFGEVKMQGEVKGQLGFHEGEQILQTILQQAGLKETQGPEEGCMYYSRK